MPTSHLLGAVHALPDSSWGLLLSPFSEGENRGSEPVVCSRALSVGPQSQVVAPSASLTPGASRWVRITQMPSLGSMQKKGLGPIPSRLQQSGQPGRWPPAPQKQPGRQWQGLQGGAEGAGAPLPAALCLPACSPRAPREAGRRLSQASSSHSCANWVSS